MTKCSQFGGVAQKMRRLFVEGCWQVLSQGNLHQKCAPFPRCTLNFNRARVFLDDTLCNGQSQPTTAAVARACGVSAVEALENIRQILSQNANTAIAHS